MYQKIRSALIGLRPSFRPFLTSTQMPSWGSQRRVSLMRKLLVPIAALRMLVVCKCFAIVTAFLLFMVEKSGGYLDSAIERQE